MFLGERVDLGAYVMQLLAGVFYVVASAAILHLAMRTRQRPEGLLGTAFLLIGIGYLFFQIPYIPGNEALMEPFSLIGRIGIAAGISVLAIFTQLVFRNDAAWAWWLARGCIAFMFLGITVSCLEGDLEGYLFLSGWGVWITWLAEVIPLAWIMLEGLYQHASAARRVEFGLSDHMVANRFLLWGCFGIAQLGAMLVEIPMNIGYELNGSVAPWTDAVAGITEYASIGLIWLAFFPPKPYRNWIASRAREAALKVG
jgi:hypothetical protein